MPVLPPTRSQSACADETSPRRQEIKHCTIISLHLNVVLSAIDLRIEVYFPFCNTYSRQVPTVKRAVSSSIWLKQRVPVYTRAAMGARWRVYTTRTRSQAQNETDFRKTAYGLENSGATIISTRVYYSGLFSLVFKPNDIVNISNHEFLTLSLILPDASANVTNERGDWNKWKNWGEKKGIQVAWKHTTNPWNCRFNHVVMIYLLFSFIYYTN